MNAVVIGASMAGLTAARVLSDRFASVTVLDRDALPVGPADRRGVPQGAQPHVLLVSGLRELESMFPGFSADLIATGATAFDTGTGLCTFRYGRRWPRAASGLDLVTASRPQFESVVRGRVAQIPGVTIRDGVSVASLAGTGDRITGVVLDDGTTIDADLVVDASGRGSRSDRWLSALGFPTPEPIEIKIGVTYTTRLYRRAAGGLDGWQAAMILPTAPHEQRIGLALPIEGDRWIVTVGGWHIASPPADAAAFDEFAASLPDPIIADLIRSAEPLTDPVTHRFPASRRRDFAALEPLPAGFVTVGDAFCSFNPLYGQGMTVAVMEARLLGAVLDHRGGPTEAMARDYYRAAATLIGTPWQFAVGGDFSFPATTGPRPRGIAVSNWYGRKLALASQVKPDINTAFVRVQQLIDPPTVLFRPSMIARVLWHTRPIAGIKVATPATTTARGTSGARGR
jgi:2-polyprenyl-6-methoxyphenol hydroxylase-like FAD-dependent oxidoreductase